MYGPSLFHGSPYIISIAENSDSELKALGHQRAGIFFGGIFENVNLPKLTTPSNLR
jgi:hypothetical protein